MWCSKILGKCRNAPYCLWLNRT
uniref:Uncharacterized protein n=1 Tax=Arundo donax TaxID=35708 RepID=A0A0A9ABU6_ARUDO